jgi:probable rRNA maturation factor
VKAIHIVKLSSWRIPRLFVEHWLTDIAEELSKSTKHDIGKKEITIAFVDKKQIKKLNKNFRMKDQATDILSFSGMLDEELGELVVCGEVVDRQAHDHGLSKKEELGYLLLHGVLHLLGYEHEKGGRAEKVMFELQDALFEVLRNKHF